MSWTPSHQTIHSALLCRLNCKANTMHRGGAAAGTLSSDEATGEVHVQLSAINITCEIHCWRRL